MLLTSTVFFVAPQADPRTQLVEVKAAFRNTVGLRPSELVRARLVYSTRRRCRFRRSRWCARAASPSSSWCEEKDGKTVVARRPVTLGRARESVLRGGGRPEAGDRVAVSSLQALRDGRP